MPPRPTTPNGFVRVRGAREHNLKNIDVDIPRDALVVFTGVSGSGKSSLAFSTLYAEAQRRYFESVAPYARRLIDQVGVPDVDAIEGLPPAVALQQQRGTPSARSSVGSVTTLSSSIRMLYSRAGHYPAGQAMLYAEDFSPNTPQGACPECHGMGRVFEVTEATMVPDPSLTIRERAVAAWPMAWQGQNQRDILVTLGYDVDIPWRDLPQAQRDWILFTEETPTAPVYAGLTPAQTRAALKRKQEPSYQGTFMGARRYVLHTFMHSQSAQMRKRVAQYMRPSPCPLCQGKRLKRESLGVTFAGMDIAELSHLSLQALAEVFRKVSAADYLAHPQDDLTLEKRLAAQRIAKELLERIDTLLDLGLGYLALERSTPTLSSGELQRLRLATQLNSQLFGVIYVLDEPSAGLHPADSEALLEALQRLKHAGNSVYVVEHDLDTMRRADWLVDVGPAAGEHVAPYSTAGRPQAWPRSSHLAPAPICSMHSPGPHVRHARPETGSRLKALPVTTSTTSAPHSRWAALPPLRAFPARASPAWSARPCWSWSVRTWAMPSNAASPKNQAWRTRLSRPAVGMSALAWIASSAWYRSTRSRSVARLAPTWPPTPACSTTCASCSRPLSRPRHRASTRGAFPSTLPRAAAPIAKAKASSALSCCSCPVSTPPAPPAMETATTLKPWR